MAEIVYKDESATDLRLHLIPGLVEKSRFSILKQGNLSFGDLHIEAHIIGASHMIHYAIQGRQLTEVLACSGGATELDANFSRAAASIPQIDVLPERGINVYDIMRRDTLVLTRGAVECLQERLQ